MLDKRFMTMSGYPPWGEGGRLLWYNHNTNEIHKVTCFSSTRITEKHS